MADNIFSQILKDQLAKGQTIPAPQVRSVGVVPDARSPIGRISQNRLKGFNAQRMAGGTPYVPGARNIGPMPTTPDPRLPMRPLGSATPSAPRTGGLGTGALGKGVGGIGLLADAYYTGRDVFNPEENIIGSIQNAATSIQNMFRSQGDQLPYTGNPNSALTRRLNQSLNRRQDTTTYSSEPGFVGPVPQPEALGGKAGPPLTLPGDQRGAWTIKGWDPNASRTAPSTDTAAPGGDVAPPASTGLSPKDRAYVEEVSRLAQQAQTDPYFQQMQQYEAARKQAVGSGNQAQMDAVRDLGLAINAAKFGTPEQRMQQTVGRFNPQMAGMPGYPATREAFEQQRPFVAPEEEARIGAMDMASQALQGAMQGQAGTQFPTQALGVMQRPTGVSPNTSAFAGPQAGQAGMSMSPTTNISALPEEAKAEFLKRLQSFNPM